MTGPPAEPPRHGWLRIAGGPWHRVCQAPAERECWRLLLGHAAREAPPSCELLVNDGRHPDHRRRPR